jgi:hemolysin D
MAALPSLIPRRREDPLAAPLSAFESETQAVILRTAPYSEHGILHILAAILAITLVLMSVVKLERVVTGNGRVVPGEGSLFVQPLDRAIIKEILVHTGDVVHKGQILATLDPTFAVADYTQLQQKVASGQALVARLEAERAGKPFDPGGEVTSYAQLQLSIWHQRQAEYQQGLADFDARIRSSEATASRAQQDIDNYSKRQVLAARVEGMQAELEKDGFGSKLKTVMATDTRVEVDRLLGEARTQLAQGRHDMAALKAQREIFISKWQDDAQTALVTARNDLDVAAQEMTKASKMHDLVTLQSPEDAVVLQIGNASVGSVVDGASGGIQPPLFTLVPLKGPLVADIQIDSKDIGFIQPGDHTEIKIDAYPFMRHGTAKGTIKTISEGSFTQDEGQQVRSPFFKARVEISDSELRDVPKSFRLIPGMTLTADVLVGHRTILSYIIEGGMRTGSEAMREP